MKKFWKEKKKIFLFFLVLFAGILWLLFFFQQKNKSFSGLPKIKEESVQVISSFFRHPLTGEKTDYLIEKPLVFAVMIENSADAWPLSGLEKAFLVIEAPVEANIPRFIAFYGSDTVSEKIGPVRSARSYYLDFASEFFSLYAHVGGSPQALDLMYTKQIFDLNQFFFGSFFWRSTDRLAPHNVYTSTDLLQKAWEKKGSSSFDYELWPFKDSIPNPSIVSSSVSILFSENLGYETTWLFDPITNTYKRLQNGKEMILSNGKNIFANNMAIMITDIKVIDQVGRRSVRTVGKGEAFIFLDGQMQKGSWEKRTSKDRLRFFNEKVEEILWNPGTTWIEIIGSKEQITFSSQE
jgi:hypothetical protein